MKMEEMKRSDGDQLDVRLNGLVYRAMGGERLPRAELLAWLSLASVEIVRLRSELSQVRNASPRDPAVVAEVAAAVAATAKAAACRHVFVEMVDGVPECSKCGAKKKANGRPRAVPAEPVVIQAGAVE
jgi:hypothetical protein